MTIPCSNPLFSVVVTLYTLFFLYSPTLLLPLALSPVFVSAGFLLLLLARLGAATSTAQEEDCSQPPLDDAGETTKPTPKCVATVPQKEEDQEQEVVHTQLNRGSNQDQPNIPYDYHQSSSNISSQWDVVGAPLEVIHEGHEAEEEEQPETHQRNIDSSSVLSSQTERKLESDQVMSRYPSLSRYYPETDSDSNSSGSEEFSVIERMCFQWEEEKDGATAEAGEDDGLIEIELDRTKLNTNDIKRKGVYIDQCECEDDEFDDEEEDSLIEIDIFSPEYGERW